MSTTKSPTQAESLMQFRRGGLFSSRFQFETKRSVAACTRSLEKLYEYKGELWLAEEFEVEVGASEGNVSRFTVWIRNRPKYNYYILSRARGEIVYDPETQRTLVTGRARFFAPFGSFLVFLMNIALLALGLSGKDGWCFIPFALVISVIVIGGAYADRAALVSSIGDAARYEHRRRRRWSKEPPKRSPKRSKRRDNRKTK